MTNLSTWMREVLRNIEKADECVDFINLAADDLPKALAIIREMREALEFRLKHGCNDTCSKSLLPDYLCTCGQEHAIKTLARADEIAGG